MGKATLARQRAIGAIGAIGLARVQRLDDAGLVVLDAVELERLRERVAELERRNKLLSDLTLGTVEQRDVAGRILQEAMQR
jgi:hypothetical protein